MAALAAGVGAALAGSPEQADAQATGLTIPHPDGARVYVVEDLSLDTQQQIMDALLGCLQEGAEVADFDGNAQVDRGEEAEFFLDDQASCAESAELQIRKAKAEAGIAAARSRIEVARAGKADAQARVEAANAEIEALTQKIIDGAQAETGS